MSVCALLDAIVRLIFHLLSLFFNCSFSLFSFHFFPWVIDLIYTLFNSYLNFKWLHCFQVLTWLRRFFLNIKQIWQNIQQTTPYFTRSKSEREREREDEKTKRKHHDTMKTIINIVCQRFYETHTIEYSIHFFVFRVEAFAIIGIIVELREKVCHFWCKKSA